MPRRARIILAGQAVHVVQRGNNRASCFFSEQDRSFYLFHLGRLLPRFGCELHAYCLMTNHVHLLFTPSREDSCALLMKHVGQLHAQYVNRAYERTGTLWEGRFRSCVVQSENYLLNCHRYIELNPVRAGLVDHPREYCWSSYRANAEGDALPVLTPHPEYLRLGLAPFERQGAYRGLFGTEPGRRELDEIRASTNGGYALGDEHFRRAMAQKLGRRVDKGNPGRPLKKEQGDAQLPLAGTEKRGLSLI